MSTRHSFYGFNSTLYSLNTAVLRSWPTRCPLPCACALHGSHAHGVCCVPGNTEGSAQRKGRPCLRTPLRISAVCSVHPAPAAPSSHGAAARWACWGMRGAAPRAWRSGLHHPRARSYELWTRARARGSLRCTCPRAPRSACRRAWAWGRTRGVHAALGASTRNKRVTNSFPGCARSGMACRHMGPALPTHPLDNGRRHAVGYPRQGPGRLA